MGGEGVVLLLLVKTRAARLPPASAADLSTQSEMNYARDSATAAGRPILLPFFLSVFFSLLSAYISAAANVKRLLVLSLVFACIVGAGE